MNGLLRRRPGFSLPRRVRPALLLVLATTASGAAAQEAGPGPVRVWLAGGLGGGASAGVDSGVALAGQLTAEWRQHHATLRTLGLVDFAGFPDSNSDDAISEVSVMYGRWSRTGLGHAAWSAGLGVVSVDGLEAEPSDVSRSTAGLSLGAEASLQADVLGVAVMAFANLNPLSSYGGLTAMLLIGWMP